MRACAPAAQRASLAAVYSANVSHMVISQASYSPPNTHTHTRALTHTYIYTHTETHTHTHTHIKTTCHPAHSLSFPGLLLRDCLCLPCASQTTQLQHYELSLSQSLFLSLYLSLRLSLSLCTDWQFRSDTGRPPEIAVITNEFWRVCV